MSAKRYDGKVDVSDLSRFVYEAEVDNNLHLYTQTLWHVSLKRTLRVVLLLNTSQATPRYLLLFSTDLHLSGVEILALYRLRFQIEFLFRDAKQFTGLTNCQARDEQALHFHFNASMSAVNLAKLDLLAQHQNQQPFVFSLNRYIHHAFSHKLLYRLLANLDLDLTCNKVKLAFERALTFGCPAP
jgi:IS4 transposase